MTELTWNPAKRKDKVWNKVHEFVECLALEMRQHTCTWSPWRRARAGGSHFAVEVVGWVWPGLRGWEVGKEAWSLARPGSERQGKPDPSEWKIWPEIYWALSMLLDQVAVDCLNGGRGEFQIYPSKNCSWIFIFSTIHTLSFLLSSHSKVHLTSQAPHSCSGCKNQCLFFHVIMLKGTVFLTASTLKFEN